MKNTTITELVKFETISTVNSDEVLSKVNLINDFLQQQDGFIDSELIKTLEENNWYLVYHIQNIEKLKVVGEKIRANMLFNELIPIILPNSMSFSFFNQIKTWEKSNK